MGQKINPKLFRMGQSVSWSGKWFAERKKYVEYLKQDTAINKLLAGKFKEAGVDKIEIERNTDTLNIIINSSRPGVVIGKGGAGIEELKKMISKKIVKDEKKKIEINIREVSKPNLSANIVAQNVATELERRVPYRRVMKRNMELVMKAGAKGVKVICSGRLGGVDIARRETLSQGKIPLHTMRADIDYSRLAARTTYGAIGVKVWIYKGEVFE
ncbi:30S ribosomal protein S3 [Candidatus Kuenenbacteria bacterium CG11_big_fil_rev_8_21_14_0_20_37_9]|uniref:Small ribosomal subunit protein uS3 n=2 Tax=Candidatus Kueneniibacteriota TaxID=1752740 RepID=A0A2M6XRP7_9BACT|nr:MAG: 30S ribosomal protein S3 [Candidatus Kuenenbacteria bacterium CG1_02_38_13]PIR05801.1 MAG: 30S ribosomal protein S3 [Candidatus Kuenenbacteria bacterium CG11_big_fil_rev_8_21_14_0_20_37_9]PIU10317.1 MAG: 30S ribosomal protein S3 [Candidatus Kuenenbacteria bacterium CG08_land_8_20_14_0_20_37_23]